MSGTKKGGGAQTAANAADADTPEQKAQLPGVLRNIENLREVANEKREMLLATSQGRSRKRRGIYVASGVLALLSGGSCAALIAPVTDLIGVKILSALFALTSGVISLVTTAYYDDKETGQINEGAGRYGDLRDQADVARSNPSLRLAEAHAAFAELTKQQSKLNSTYDQWIDAQEIGRRAREIADRINARAKREDDERQAKAQAGGGGGGGGGSGGGGGGGASPSWQPPIPVAPIPYAAPPPISGMTYTPIHREP